MTGARLTAALECANDAGGRCALWPSGDAHACYGVSHDTATSCAFAAGSVSAARAALTGTGATPQSEGLVRVRRQVCLRTPAPVPSGSLPIHQSLRGKAVQRRFEAAEHQFVGRLSVGLSDIAEQGRGRDGRGRSPRRQAWDAPVLGTQKAFPHGIPGPERHRRSGDRGATAKQPATYETAGAHIATVFPCTCTSMSMCTRGTPPTPGDRRSRSAPRAALDTSAKQPAHHSAGLVNREAPARRVIGSERPERRKARRTRNRPSGEDAFSARSFRRADRAVHHRGGIE